MRQATIPAPPDALSPLARPRESAPTADEDGEELLVEKLIAAEIEAVQHVLVAGRGRAYLACVLSLKTQSRSAEEELDRPALQFAQRHGSAARTVDEARQCARFRAGLLLRFSACNKLVYERTRAQGVREKPKQLRRFMIVSQAAFQAAFRQVSGDGCDDRTQILDAFAEYIASMYEVVESLVPAIPPPDPMHHDPMHGTGATAEVTTSVCQRGVLTSPASDSSVSEADGHQEGPGKIVDLAKSWTLGYDRHHGSAATTRGNSKFVVLSKEAKPPFGGSPNQSSPSFCQIVGTLTDLARANACATAEPICLEMS
jgi:hypothetical protein